MDDLAETFERYADWADDVSPLYGTLARTAADDPRLLDIAAESRAGQPAPQLLLAAVHALLLAGSDHPLAGFYPSCGGDDPDDDPGLHFREFCLVNEERLRRTVASRRVQTNDVGRSAVLLPAFEHVARAAGTRSLAQIEIGASAGLNLNWDRYAYEFDGVGRAGPRDSPVRIAPEVRGNRRPPLPEDPPSVEYRTGVDLNPLDPTDPADARWLRALVHPDQPRRHDRLAAALEVARQHPPEVTRGDVLERLPDLLSRAPEDAALVVYSTHVLYQLEESTVAALRSLLANRVDQPVYWLSIDPDEDLGTPVYRLVTCTDGGFEESQLARFESYGAWIRWLGSRLEYSSASSARRR